MRNQFMWPIDGELGGYGGQRTGALLGGSRSVQSVNPATQVYHRIGTSYSEARNCRAAGAVNGDLGARAQEWWRLPFFMPTGDRFRKGMRGIQFMTNVPPTHPSPSMAIWVHGYHPDIALRQNSSDVFAVIRVTMISKVP